MTSEIAEKWVRWYPLDFNKNIVGEYFNIESINSSNGELKCIMIHEKQKIEVDFGSSFIAYQYIPELYRLRTMGNELFKRELDLGLNAESSFDQAAGHNFFISEDSYFLNRIKKTEVIKNSAILIHYVVFDGNYCFDVISSRTPQFNITKLNGVENE